MIDPAVWRDADSESARLGVVVSRHVLTILAGRRCYRLRWSGPWTKPAPDDSMLSGDPLQWRRGVRPTADEVDEAQA